MVDKPEQLTSFYVDLLDVDVEDPSSRSICRLNSVLGEIVLFGCINEEHGRVVVGEPELANEHDSTFKKW